VSEGRVMRENTISIVRSYDMSSMDVIALRLSVSEFQERKGISQIASGPVWGIEAVVSFNNIQAVQ
jgi:hypothetical protein